MQRGILKCDATTCVHNRSYECKAGTIHVSGRGAEEVEGTSCTTFAERDSSSITNSLASNVLLVFQILLKFIPDSVYTDKSVVNT